MTLPELLERKKQQQDLEIIIEQNKETQKLVKDVLVFLDQIKENIDHNISLTENIHYNISAQVIQPQHQEQNPDLAKIKWESAVGPKGQYELTRDIDNTEYKRLFNYLNEHKGKAQLEGSFLSIFQDNVTIGKWKAKYEKKQYDRSTTNG